MVGVAEWMRWINLLTKGAIVNLSRTVGVCVAVVGLVVLGCSAAPETEFERTLRIAKTGDAVAQYNLGLMYYDGTGVPQDHVEAVKWFRMAAEQGFAMAQYNLGLMYANGTGVPQDHVEAYAWWSVAAAGGDANAANNRDIVKESLSGSQLAQGQRRATELFEKHGSK